MFQQHLEKTELRLRRLISATALGLTAEELLLPVKMNGATRPSSSDAAASKTAESNPLGSNPNKKEES